MKGDKITENIEKLKTALEVCNTGGIDCVRFKKLPAPLCNYDESQLYEFTILLTFRDYVEGETIEKIQRLFPELKIDQIDSFNMPGKITITVI